jgi:3-hydroxybutyryl-CoA dehydrogenase
VTDAAGPVGVVGAGTIGQGVAQSFASAGHPVSLVDVSERVLDDAMTGIERTLRLAAFEAPPGADAPAVVLERITPTVELAALRAAVFVVENVTERWEAKAPLWEEMDGIAAEAAVLAANTSAIPIARFAAATRRPDRVLGLHFMNPVPLKDTVEVVRGTQTGEETVRRALDVLAGIGKTGIVVNDSPGFVLNRVLMLAVNEAAALVREKVAPAEDVDALFRSCLGHTMGPLETGDLIGLDTIVLTLEVLEEELGDGRFRPDPLLRRMVESGVLGRKTGAGFHDYALGAARA